MLARKLLVRPGRGSQLLIDFANGRIVDPSETTGKHLSGFDVLLLLRFLNGNPLLGGFHIGFELSFGRSGHRGDNYAGKRRIARPESMGGIPFAISQSSATVAPCLWKPAPPVVLRYRPLRVNAVIALRIYWSRINIKFEY